MARTLQFEWNSDDLQRQFKALKKHYKNKASVRKIARPASKIAVKFLRTGAIVRGDTVSGDPPPSYYLPKRRKRKGIDAVYYAGNARRSLRTFSFRKSYFMHVGAKVNRGAKAGGVFNSGYKSEGYYNYFLEYGTKHMSPRRHMSKAIIQASQPVERALVKSMNRDLMSIALRTKR